MAVLLGTIVDLPPTSIADDSNPSRRLATLFSVLVLMTSTMLAYSNSLAGPFVFDDIPTIVESPSIRNVWGIRSLIFDAGETAVGRPLANFSFALNYAYNGLNVGTYHLANIGLHMLAALTLFGVIRQTLERSAVAARFRNDSTLIALLGALVWTLHPLQTESVTYVVQRCESVAGLFYLLTLYCAILASSSGHSTAWSMASVVSCLCCVGSKEVSVSAPLTVIVYDWAFSGCTLRSLLSQRRWLYAALFCTWIPLVGLVSLGRGHSAGFNNELSSWDYSMTQFGAIVRYLRLSFFPDALVLDYVAFVVRNIDEIFPAALVVVLLISGTIVAIRSQRWIAFLGFVFFATLSPSSSFIPIVTQTIAEHRMFLPLAAIVVFVVDHPRSRHRTFLFRKA